MSFCRMKRVSPVWRSLKARLTSAPDWPISALIAFLRLSTSRAQERRVGEADRRMNAAKKSDRLSIFVFMAAPFPAYSNVSLAGCQADGPVVKKRLNKKGTGDGSSPAIFAGVTRERARRLPRTKGT